MLRQSKPSTLPMQSPLPEVLQPQDLPRHTPSVHYGLVEWEQSVTSAESTQSTSGRAPAATRRATSNVCSRSSLLGSHSAASVHQLRKRPMSATPKPRGRGGSSASAARCTPGVVALCRRSASWRTSASQQAAPQQPLQPAPLQLSAAPSPASRQPPPQEPTRQHLHVLYPPFQNR